MPKPYDLNLHKSYNVNNNDKNYKSFTDANGEQWYTDKPLTTYNNNKLAYVTNGRHSKWVTISDQFNTQPQTLAREQAVKRDLIKPRIQAANSLTQGLADIITGGMAGSLREGAQNLTKGNYIKGISQLATPAMFGSGVAGNIARAGIGSYNLLNEDGVRKTYKYINNGDYAFYHTKVYSNFIKDGLINLENIKGLKNTSFSLEGTTIPKDIKHVTLKLGKNLNTIINDNGGYSNTFQVFGEDSFSIIKWSIELNPENKYLTLNKYDGYQVLLLPLKEVITNTKNFQKINKAYKPSTNMDNLFACIDTGLDENYPSIIKYPEGIEMMMAGSTRGIFQTTDKLMTIVFPESLKHIGDRFMQYANSVETLVFKSTEPPLCNEIFMSFNKNLTKVYVPKASIDKYKNNFKYILGNRTNQQLLAIEDMPEDLKAKLL